MPVAYSKNKNKNKQIVFTHTLILCEIQQKIEINLIKLNYYFQSGFPQNLESLKYPEFDNLLQKHRIRDILKKNI